jgi:hypothetical protein
MNFPVLANNFPVSPSEFPVRFLREIPKKTLGYRDILSSADAPTALISRISLYFSLLAGNLGRRPVRNGLRRQPASPVSMSNLQTSEMFATFQDISA